jgi:hypothetical protein
VERLIKELHNMNKKTVMDVIEEKEKEVFNIEEKPNQE